MNSTEWLDLITWAFDPRGFADAGRLFARMAVENGLSTMRYRHACLISSWTILLSLAIGWTIFWIRSYRAMPRV